MVLHLPSALESGEARPEVLWAGALLDSSAGLGGVRDKNRARIEELFAELAVGAATRALQTTEERGRGRGSPDQRCVPRRWTRDTLLSSFCHSTGFCRVCEGDDVEVRSHEVPSVQELFDDAMELRRGHGLFAADAPARAGTAIRGQCGVMPGDNDAVIRRKILLHLADVAAQLPDNLRPVVEAALALHPATRHQALHQRMQWAAHEVGRDHPRTAHRRIEPAFMFLAELLQLHSAPPLAQRDWYTRDLTAILRMDVEPPQLVETRTILSTVDDLDELKIEISAPKDARLPARHRVIASVVYGGEIVDRDETASGYTCFTVRLPEPLVIGQEHEYSVEFTSFPQEFMRPYYVLTPYRRCDHFSVRVRFGPDNAPKSVWRLNGTPGRKIDDFVHSGDPVELDSILEAELVFTEMVPGLSYGLQWLPADRPSPRVGVDLP